MFDSINRNILISRLKLKIRDQRLFEILLKMFKIKIISFIGVLKENLVALQGNILSPILANIYFHDLDVYVEEKIIKRYSKGLKATRCSFYQRAITLTPEEKKASEQKRKQIARKKQRDAHKTGLRYIIVNDTFVRVRYLRYADDFLIGVRGSKVLAKKILRSVKFFLKSDLHLSLNERKFEIIDSFSNKVDFLGMLIYNVAYKYNFFCKSRAIENAKRKKNRVISGAQALEHRQAKKFKEECLLLLKKAYIECRIDRKPFRKNLITLIKNSLAYSEVIHNPNRIMWREFVQTLQKITQVKENKKLKDFLKI